MSETIYCLQCNNPIKSKYAKKFCGSSCAASYNNKGVRRHGVDRGVYESSPKTCKKCDTNIPYTKRRNTFCSPACARPMPSIDSCHDRHKCMNCSATVNNKYCNNSCRQEYEWKQKILLIEYGNGSPRSVKKYLLETAGHKCNNCGNSEWNGQPIPIELEHIDGNSENNNLDNCELLCPNCHAQTPTYKNRNKGNGRHSRRQRYADGLSY